MSESLVEGEDVLHFVDFSQDSWPIETLSTNLQHPPQALVHLLLLPFALLAASLSPPAIQHPLALRQDARKGWDERNGGGGVCLHACVCAYMCMCFGRVEGRV